MTSTEGRHADETALGGPLAITGGPLEPIIARFRAELERAGVRHPQPHFYLADEWGVIFDDERPWPSSRSIAIPFYLARPELTALHARHGYRVEGATPEDVLRYLRHEMGHVVNYAYRLYTGQDWAGHFGDFRRPYEEEYEYDTSSRDFVQHLGRKLGWYYAQKHPDEDWAETFAVWMTAGLDWRTEYAPWSKALAKLTYCDRVMAALAKARCLPETTTVAESEVYTRVPDGWYTDLSSLAVTDAPFPCC
jgi:hypothetical protein